MTVGEDVYVHDSQSSSLPAAGPCSRWCCPNPSLWLFSLLALQTVPMSVGSHSTGAAVRCPRAVTVFACVCSLATWCAASITKGLEKHAPSGFPSPDVTTPKSDLILLCIDLKTSHQLVVREIK